MVEGVQQGPVLVGTFFTPDDPVHGFGPCSCPPRMLQSAASLCRILSVASDAPVRGPGFPPGRSSPGACAVLHSAPDAPIRGVFCRILSVASDAPVPGTGFSPGRSSPGAWAVLHSAPDAPIRGVFLSYSLHCLGRSSPWHRVHPRTIQSGGLGPAPLRPGCSNPGRLLSYSLRCLGRSSPWHRVLPRTIQSGRLGRAPPRPGCSNPGRLFVVFSPLPRTFQSVAPGSPPDYPVRGLGPCSTPPRMLQSGASFCRILSVASDAPVRGTGFTPGRSGPGASAVRHSAPDAPIRGFILSYSLRCLGCSSPWHLAHPRTIHSGG